MTASVTPSFGFEQNSQNSEGSKTEAARGMAAFLLVEENEICAELERERQGLGFAEIEVSSEDPCSSLVADLVTVDPGGIFNFLAAWMTPAPLC